MIRLRYYIGAIVRSLNAIMAVITIMGIVTFSLFILEESFQTVMFGTWPAQDAQRWDLVKEGVEHMERIETTIKWVNRSIGWIQPLAFVSYREYAKASDFYGRALKAKALAHAPELFDGESIDIVIPAGTPHESTPDGYLARVGSVYVSVDRVDLTSRKISGVLHIVDGKTILKEK